jgi:hypothetical protein
LLIIEGRDKFRMNEIRYRSVSYDFPGSSLYRRIETGNYRWKQ